MKGRGHTHALTPMQMTGHLFAQEDQLEQKRLLMLKTSFIFPHCYAGIFFHCSSSMQLALASPLISVYLVQVNRLEKTEKWDWQSSGHPLAEFKTSLLLCSGS